MDDIHSILRQYWGYDDFRPLQEDIIHSVLDGRDTLGLMPTGGGKSLTFQVPALAMDGMCLVISPLIALMKDQVRNLQSRGIKATAVYSGMDQQEIMQQLDNAMFGDYKFLYISPERITTAAFLQRINDMRICLIAVDESHCISQWGYDFRPSYLRIAELRDYLPDTPVLALTATATPDVIDDIQKQLKFREPNVFRKSFARNNLLYLVRQCENKPEQALRILKGVPGSAVIYVRNRKRTQEMAAFLRQQGITAEHYHAGLTNQEKDERQQRWMSEETRVIVATNAFGMGIDKAEVRCVIHLDIPDTLEAYFQEAGRAGRDGQTAYAILLYSPVDIGVCKRRVSQNFPERPFILDVYEKLFNYYQIGMGSGMNHTLAFHIGDFCQRFKLPVLPTYHALKILQQAGYMEISEEVATPPRVQITSQRDELYLHQRSEREEAVLRALLRNYTGLFSDPVRIDTGRMATQTGLTERQVHETLIEMARMRLLHYIPHQITPYIILLVERMRREDIIISRAIYEERKQHFEKKIAAILEYTTQTLVCRSQLLLDYFGESNAPRCGVCDICRAQGQQPEEKIIEQIRQRLDAGLITREEAAQLLHTTN